MGLTVSAIFSRIFGKKQMRILMGESGETGGGGERDGGDNGKGAMGGGVGAGRGWGWG